MTDLDTETARLIAAAPDMLDAIYGLKAEVVDLLVSIAALQADVVALTARAEAAEAEVERLVEAASPIGRMAFMDDRADDDDVCLISAKTIKGIRAAIREMGKA